MAIITDGNSLGYASQSTKKLVANDIEVQAVFNSLRTLKSIKIQNEDYGPLIWLWDGRAQFRFDTYPEYKAQRDKDPALNEIRDNYKKVKPILEEALTFLGVNQAIAPAFEADDLAGFFVRKAEKKKAKSILITGDCDWQQLISPLTAWHDPRRNPGKYCSHETFKSVTGYDDVFKFLEGKALVGDSSDNITGIAKIGEKTAAKILEEYSSVMELIRYHREVEEFTKDNLPESLTRARNPLNKFCTSGGAVFARNYRLMNLISESRDEEIGENIQLTRGDKDINAFKALCHEHSFLSIVREIDKWNKAF